MMPLNQLSTRPVPSAFMPPRTVPRVSPSEGLSDLHFGGIALGDTTHGITYQTWQAFADGTNIFMSAPNTAPFVELVTATPATWIGMSIDQNARVFLTYADGTGNAFYYWFDSTIPGYRLSSIPGPVFRPFTALDDNRIPDINSSDILLCYVRSGVLYMRQQRDRFGIEYTLGNVPSSGVDLTQIGFSHGLRFQFELQLVNPDGGVVPPMEWNVALGFNEPA